ncbi:hypothetical protein EYY84_12840 [Hafnia alvei]|nr:hypothetical protein EYY84_12840 [Hafnia alvei]
MAFLLSTHVQRYDKLIHPYQSNQIKDWLGNSQKTVFFYSP